MNEEQTKQLEIAIDAHRRTLDTLEDEIAVESHRRTLQMLEDKEFMEGVFEAMEAVKRGERGVPGKELKRKYKRA